MAFKERNELIKELYISDELSMEQIGKRFGISRNRVKQILWAQGVIGKEVKAQKHARLLREIKSLIEQQPHLSNSQLAERLNVNPSFVRILLSKAGIKRDVVPIFKELSRNGRVKLTRKLLHRLYIIKEKSITEIAKELGYSYDAIRRNLKRCGIETRRPGRNNKPR